MVPSQVVLFIETHRRLRFRTLKPMLPRMLEKRCSFKAKKTEILAAGRPWIQQVWGLREPVGGRGAFWPGYEGTIDMQCIDDVASAPQIAKCLVSLSCVFP